MKKLILFICFLTISQSYGQEAIYKYYVHINDYQNPPKFVNIDGLLLYNDNNISLKFFLTDYNITFFSQAFPTSTRPLNLEVFVLETKNNNLMPNLVNNFPSIFKSFTEIINDKPELQSFPNDYGISNPNGNAGASIDRNDLDYINIAKAWNITTGLDIVTRNPMKIGISDARIKIDDPDFINKVTFINAPYSQNYAYNPNNIETVHGTETAGIAAAQGNNNYGSTGICYDCTIVSTQYGNYNNLLLLAQAGVRVINMSWASTYGTIEEQNIVDEIVQDYNTVLVAAGGNVPSHQTNENARCRLSHWDSTLNRFVPNFTGIQYFYPASFNGVISVSGLGHKYFSTDTTNIAGISPFGFPVARFTKDSFSPNVNVVDTNNPIGLRYHGWSDTCYDPNGNPHYPSPQGIVWTYTFNDKIDILAPGYTNFMFPLFAEENGAIGYYDVGGTSSATPYVSGTVALMISVNNCLTPSEVDNILKLTTKDVEAMPINKNFVGYIGAGGLNAGDAVEFVNETKKTNGNAIIDNHIFNRFDFDLQKINNNLTIQNVTFKDNCKVNFTAKNQIHLLPNTNFIPNINGNVYLSINSLIDVSCNPANFAKSSDNSKKDKSAIALKSSVKLYPNPNTGSFYLLDIKNKEFKSKNIQLQVLDLNGRNLYERNLIGNDFTSYKVDLNYLSSGIYIVKLSSENHSIDIKFIKN